MAINTKSIVVLSVSSALHWLIVSAFVNYFDLGYFGVCLATSLHFFVRFFISTVYIETNLVTKNVY